MIATTMGAEIAFDTRLSIEDKGKLQREHQFSMCVVDCLGLCSTMRMGVNLEDQARAYTIVTGIEMDAAGLYLAAERIINLERLYNAGLGFDRKDDVLPRRLVREPMPSGPSEGHVVDLEPMLDDYYDAMGWDKNGLPTNTKLAELGLA